LPALCKLAALGADTLELHPAPQDLVTTLAAHHVHNSNDPQRCIQGYVINLAAGDAPDVHVFVCRGIKPPLSLPHIEFLEKAACTKVFKVTIDSAKADLGELRPHDFIDIICRGMAFNLSQFLKDNHPLLRHSFWLSHHIHPSSAWYRGTRRTDNWLMIIITINKI
jgi:hypothetical protein